MTIKYSVLLSERIKDIWGFCIEEGDYKDVLISLNSFYSDPLNPDSLNVEHYLVFKPDNVSNDMLESKEFKTICEEIIYDVLEGALGDTAGNEDTETFST